MLATFFRPDGTEITNGGTSNGSCGVEDVKSAVKQAYDKIFYEGQLENDNKLLGEDKLPMAYCTEILGPNVRDFNSAGDKCILITSYSGVSEVKLVSQRCFPTHMGCTALWDYVEGRSDKAPCEACNNKGMKFGEKVAIAAAERINDFGK